MDSYNVNGKVEIFPGPGGWHFARVPTTITKPIVKLANSRGFIPIVATTNKTTWQTSLLPMGDGTHFIALPKKVRAAENIAIDNKVFISFKLRLE